MEERGGERSRKREMTRLPKVITFSLFISLFIYGCVQTELIIEIPERKCLHWNPITSRPSVVAQLVNIHKCTAPTNNILSAALDSCVLPNLSMLRFLFLLIVSDWDQELFKALYLWE